VSDEFPDGLVFVKKCDLNGGRSWHRPYHDFDIRIDCPSCGNREAWFAGPVDECGVYRPHGPCTDCGFDRPMLLEHFGFNHMIHYSDEAKKFIEELRKERMKLVVPCEVKK